MREMIYIEEDLGIWNRKLLNIYWYSMLILTLGEGASFFVTEDPPMQFVKEYILLPSVLLLIVLGITEILFRRFPGNANIIMISGNFVASITIYVHAYVDSIFLMYLLPVLVATFYFRKKYIWQTSLLNCLSFIILYIISDKISLRLSITEVISTLILVGVGAPYISSKIIDRGESILRSTRIDALSGLYNHKTFHDTMQYWMTAGQSRRIGLVLAILDIDNFKSVNDTYGHQAGDEVIRTLSEIMSQTAGEKDVVSRYGGEEFAILFVGRTWKEAYQLCEQIRETFSRTLHPSLGNKAATVSIGLSAYDETLTKEVWFEQADQQLYQAKRSGKNRTCSQVETDHFAH